MINRDPPVRGRFLRVEEAGESLGVERSASMLEWEDLEVRACGDGGVGDGGLEGG